MGGKKKEKKKRSSKEGEEGTKRRGRCARKEERKKERKREEEKTESVRMSFEKFAHVRFCFRKASSPWSCSWNKVATRRMEGDGSSDRYVSQSKGTYPV